LDVAPAEFLMIGNSLKSDVLPVLTIGGHGFHIPYHITWGHEKIDKTIEHPHFKELNSIIEVMNYL
jgi:putative hydrolase of the HAD superfamily